MGKKDRKPYLWEIAQDFIDPPTGITLRVSKNDATPPGYSWQQGNRPIDGTADERIRPFNRILLDYGNNNPVVDVPFEVVVRLMAEMKTWIELDAKAEAERLARKKT